MAGNNAVLDDATKEHVRALLASLEQDDGAQALQLLDDLVKRHEAGLFNEIGRLTRELHDAMQAFRLDQRVAELASSEIPDAKERLNYVVTMTEQAANRVLNAVEESIPISENIEGSARRLRERWDRFRNRNMTLDEFRSMSRDIDEFLRLTEADSSRLRERLSDVLMAQDFQDITGQIIRRVIKLVQEVEDNLVGMLRITGHRMLNEKKESTEAKAVEAEGPCVPGVDEKDRVSGQDDVDELLSSLGF